jgi:hypothetical protein
VLPGFPVGIRHGELVHVRQENRHHGICRWTQRILLLHRLRLPHLHRHRCHCNHLSVVFSLPLSLCLSRSRSDRKKKKKKKKGTGTHSSVAYGAITCTTILTQLTRQLVVACAAALGGESLTRIARTVSPRSNFWAESVFPRCNL